jgi:hypothetical protein
VLKNKMNRDLLPSELKLVLAVVASGERGFALSFGRLIQQARELSRALVCECVCVGARNLLLSTATWRFSGHCRFTYKYKLKHHVIYNQ